MGMGGGSYKQPETDPAKIKPTIFQNEVPGSAVTRKAIDHTEQPSAASLLATPAPVDDEALRRATLLKGTA